MEPKVTARHIKMLIFAWLHGEIAELQQNTGYTIFPEKAYKILTCLAGT